MGACVFTYMNSQHTHTRTHTRSDTYTHIHTHTHTVVDVLVVTVPALGRFSGTAARGDLLCVCMCVCVCVCVCLCLCVCVRVCACVNGRNLSVLCVQQAKEQRRSLLDSRRESHHDFSLATQEGLHECE